MGELKKCVTKLLKGAKLPLTKNALLVIVHCKIPVPLSFRQHKRDKMHNFPHVKRPDGDNLEKFINDALKGVLWHDDSSITWMLRSKTLTKEKKGEIIIFIRELENNSAPNYDQILNDITNNINLNYEVHDEAS